MIEMPLKTIEKMILRELGITFLLGLLAFNFILMMEKVLRLTRLLSSVGASLEDMLRIVAFIQPQLLLLTTPMAFLISVLVTYGRMNMDSEMVAMRASGMSMRLISAPVLYLGLACFGASIAFSFYLIPESSRGLRETLGEVVSRRAPLAFEEGAFNTSFKDVIMRISRKSEDETLGGIFIYDERRKNEPKTILAKTGRIFPQNPESPEGLDISFILDKGMMHLTNKNISTEIYFDRYSFVLPIVIQEQAKKRSELGPMELLSEASINEGKEKIQLLLEFHRRLTLPFICIPLILLGPPLALLSGKTGRFGGLTLGFIVLAAYYSVLTYGENLAIGGNVPHYIGAWGPAFLLTAAGAYLFRKAEKE